MKLSDDSPPHIDVHLRDRVLIWASALTADKANPATVLSHAKPLLAWLADASTGADLHARTAALSRQHANTHLAPGYKPDNDPQRLLAAAQELYTFLQPASPECLTKGPPSGAQR